MKKEMTLFLKKAWPRSSVEERGKSLCAYISGHLVGEIVLYPEVKWAFVHYGYGGFGGVGNISSAFKFLDGVLKAAGWTYTVKGGNPLLEGKDEPAKLREFGAPTDKELAALREYLLAYLTKRFPKAKVIDLPIYAGMGWVMASNGNDALGIRDIDVNCFFAEGGPKSLAWITKLKWKFRGMERVIDLYWNTLPAKMTPVEYIKAKSAKAKAGRWLTIPNRPWVSLLSGETIWKGRMG